jgi:hypothetical protein
VHHGLRAPLCDSEEVVTLAPAVSAPVSQLTLVLGHYYEYEEVVTTVAQSSVELCSLPVSH